MRAGVAGVDAPAQWIGSGGASGSEGRPRQRRNRSGMTPSGWLEVTEVGVVLHTTVGGAPSIPSSDADRPSRWQSHTTLADVAVPGVSAARRVRPRTATPTAHHAHGAVHVSSTRAGCRSSGRCTRRPPAVSTPTRNPQAQDAADVARSQIGQLVSIAAMRTPRSMASGSSAVMEGGTLGGCRRGVDVARRAHHRWRGQRGGESTRG